MPTIAQWIIGILTIFWIISISDAIKSKSKNKYIWIVIVIAFHILGTLLYFFFGTDKTSPFRIYTHSLYKRAIQVFADFSLFSKTLFLDVLFWIGVASLWNVVSLIINTQAKKLEKIDPSSLVSGLELDDITNAVQDQVIEATVVMKSAYITLFATLIIFALLCIILYSLFHGLVWAMIAKKKVSRSYLFKFLLFSLLSAGVLAIIITFFAIFSTRDRIFNLIPYIVLIFAYFYFTALYLFVRNNKIFASMRLGFVQAITYFFKLVAPFTIIAAFYVFSFSLVFFITKLQISLLTTLVNLISLLIFFAFFRIFLFKTYTDIIK